MNLGPASASDKRRGLHAVKTEADLGLALCPRYLERNENHNNSASAGDAETGKATMATPLMLNSRQSTPREMHILNMTHRNPRDSVGPAGAGTSENGKANFVTPLMLFLKEKHSLRAPEPRKAPAQRKGAASGRGRSAPLAPIGEDDVAVPRARRAAPKPGAKGREAQVQPVHDKP